jgi:hypothetical protein
MRSVITWKSLANELSLQNMFINSTTDRTVSYFVGILTP